MWSRRCRASGGACVITADHGNATTCSTRTGRSTPRTRSTRCRCIVTADGVSVDGEGILADVAPTILALLGIDQPEQMTGRSLLS